jgi:nucleoid DNA-binding protein
LDITAHIRELLFGHDCVIIPGFGGFIGNYTPARIDKNTNTFYPPVKQISFNRNLNHNDGLLIGKISESLQVNYGDARSMAEQFATDITKRLAKGEKVVFDHIGTFMNNHEGNVQFEPDRDANYHLNSYGLGSFQFMPLEGYDLRKRVAGSETRDPLKQVTLRKYLWRAAVIVPLLGIVIAVPLTTNLFKTRVESTNLNPLASVETENKREAANNDKQTDTGLPVIKNIPETAPTTETIVPSNAAAEASSGPAESYYVIAGSFQSESNAMNLMKKLSGEGYTPELINGPNGFYRVGVSRCGNLAEAVQKKDSISRKYSGAWIARIR